MYDYKKGARARFGSKLLLTAGLAFAVIIFVNGTFAHSGDLKNSRNAVITGSLLGEGLTDFKTTVE